MTDEVSVSKDEDNQRPIPSSWRGTLCDVVEAFKEGDFNLSRGVSGVGRITTETAADIARNIEDYGVHLASLPEQSWDTSVCQWMGEYWDALVDLFTEEEGASDLVLAVRVFENGEKYAFDIQSVYVP